MSPVYYNCMAKNKTILDLSSSGGISAIFAKAILDKGGIVYGAMFERDFKSVKVDWVNNNYSDFIVGDYWEYKKNKETMFDPTLTVEDGISYLKVSTEKGLALFNEVKEQLDYKEFDIDKIQY